MLEGVVCSGGCLEAVACEMEKVPTSLFHCDTLEPFNTMLVGVVVLAFSQNVIPVDTPPGFCARLKFEKRMVAEAIQRARLKNVNFFELISSHCWCKNEKINRQNFLIFSKDSAWIDLNRKTQLIVVIL